MKIGGMAAARVGDSAVCIPVGPTDKVKQGSKGVKINGKEAARMLDQMDHGGIILAGCPNVLIGGGSSGGSSGGVASPVSKPGNSGAKKNKANKPEKKSCTAGEPVDVTTGEEIFSLIDFTIPGQIPITWSRTYRSNNNKDIGLGLGWSHSYSMYIEETEGAIIYHDS